MEENINNNQEFETTTEQNISDVNKNTEQKQGSNNKLFILAIVLSVIAIVFSAISLFGGKEETALDNKKNAKTIQSGDLRIAYVDTDTILAKYDMAVEMQKSLEEKQKQAENSFKQQQASLEKDYKDYMTNGDKLTLTQQKAKEQELQQRMQNLQQMPTKLQSDLQQEQMTQNKKLLDAVYAFIKDYNAKHDKYNIILSKSYVSSPTLYMDEGMDITDEIVKGLNEEYKEYKKK
ncbi:MAG: OmpH family outer membrane protein [Bacteroidota bacterium]|nr:OmpH family outer membrane protein [Bacteroidota bacterium]